MPLSGNQPFVILQFSIWFISGFSDFEMLEFWDFLTVL